METSFDTSTTNSSGAGRDNKQTLTLIGLGITITVSLVAIILSAVALDRPVKSSHVTEVSPGGGNVQSTGGGKRIWTIAYVVDWGAYSYFDKTGYIKGFANEVIMKACEVAEMDCQLIWSQIVDCWDSHPGQHPRPGRGIIDGWYDACAGWVHTVERGHSLKFSNPFIPMKPAALRVKQGNADSFDFSDLTGKKIGFVDGWATSEQCLARMEDENHRNYILPAENIKHASSAEQLVKFLIDGKVDAIFTATMSYEQYKGIEDLKDFVPVNCHIGGIGMMTRKDNEFNTYFNIGLQKIMESGEYTRMCEQAKQEQGHKGDIDCFNI